MNKIVEEHINNIISYIIALENGTDEEIENYQKKFLQTYSQISELVKSSSLNQKEKDILNKYSKLSNDLYYNINILISVGRKKYNDSYFIESLKKINNITTENSTGLPLGYEEDMLKLFEDKNNKRNGR